MCIGTNPPPEIVLPESTLGGIGTTNPTVETPTTGSPDLTMGSPDPTMGSPGVTGPGNGSGAASIAAMCHLILLTVTMVVLL